MTTTASRLRSAARFSREAAALVEYGRLATSLPRLRAAPSGDGHPVFVLPGWLAGDATTLVLRRFLRSKRYRVSGWGLGINWGSRVLFEAFEQWLRSRHAAAQPPASLIGWSLGGIAARWAAHRVPGAVRQVLTLSSPFRTDPREAPFWPVYRRVAGVTEADFCDAELSLLASVPRVPTTAIVSPDDALVSPAEASELTTKTSETIVVRGSHAGLCHNPVVLAIVADRLAQPRDAWRPFRAPDPSSAP